MLFPEQGAPKIYREYPLRGSGFVPLNFVFDGKFDPDQERIKLLMSDEDKGLLEDAFAAGVVAVKYAFAEGWEDAHLLARAAHLQRRSIRRTSKKTNGGSSNLPALRRAWRPCRSSNVLRSLYPQSGQTAGTRILSFPGYCQSTTDETTVARLWPLVAACTQLMPPKKELAVEWTEIAEGWRSLGWTSHRITLGSLAEWVRDEAKELDELHLEGDKTEWLASFLDAVGECWGKRAGVDVSAHRNHARSKSASTLAIRTASGCRDLSCTKRYLQGHWP